MRIFKVSAVAALALAYGTAAAVVVIPTGGVSPTAVERPHLVERQAVTAVIEEREAAALPSAQVGPAIASYAQSIVCSKAGFFNAFCDSPLSATPTPTIFGYQGFETAESRMVGQDADFVEREAVITVIEVRQVEASPWAQIGSVLAGYAYSIACAGASRAGPFSTLCASPTTALSNVRRDRIVQDAGPLTTSWTTIKSTSTIASTTTTVHVAPASDASFKPYFTAPSLDSTSSSFHSPVVAVVHIPISSTVSNSVYGVSIVQTTVVKTVTTVTVNPSAPHTTSTTQVVVTSQTVETPYSGNSSESSVVSPSLATDTDIYINISTWSNTEWTYAPETTLGMSDTVTLDSASTSTIETPAHANGPWWITDSVAPVATSTDDTMGFTGAVTTTLGSAAGKSIDLDGFHVPGLMIAAMAACFALALLL